MLPRLPAGAGPRPTPAAPGTLSDAPPLTSTDRPRTHPEHEHRRAPHHHRYPAPMTPRASAALLSAGLLALTACSQLDDGDRVACETFADGHNTMMGSVYDGSERDSVKTMTAAHVAGIDDALLVVKSPELTIALANAAKMSLGLGGDGEPVNEDMGTAYFLYANDVFETCQGLGADVEEIENTAAD